MHMLKKFLEYKAYRMRIDSLLMTTAAGSGHPTSALSAADIVSALFFHAMCFDPQNPENPNNDRFILSKGHASPIFYAACKELGIISQEQELTYRKFNSVLEGHPTLRFRWTEAATGSLGMGLSIGAGMALSAKMDERRFYTYVLLGDSEVAEGSVWEAAELAAFYKLDNLVGIIDCNRLGQSTQTMHAHHVQRYAAKFKSFGWKTLVIDGHNMTQILGALDKARDIKDHPVMIIAKTIKGYGITGVEDKEGYHGKVFSKEQVHDIIAGLDERFAKAARFDPKSFKWERCIPLYNKAHEIKQPIVIKPRSYELGQMVATRYAYGQAITDAGAACKTIISLDAEVKNSTYAELFQEQYPERFIQCFIAEQNMVSMGVGLQRRGKIPFISTFGAFFSRAHDQIRMAAIGTAALRLCGSHAGVSIGQDGPSQMALEDIALMQALPQSIVLYPADAPSTHQLVGLMAQYDQGISYLRTTRAATPVLYDSNELFVLGGCKVLRKSNNDVACVVGAGITLHEALKAYEHLLAQGISISVIDLYSIKPLDAQTLISVARESNNVLITVEDHYLQGGLGEAVVYELANSRITVECLAVRELPRSGKPEELLAWAGIDAATIEKTVKRLAIQKPEYRSKEHAP